MVIAISFFWVTEDFIILAASGSVIDGFLEKI